MARVKQSQRNKAIFVAQIPVNKNWIIFFLHSKPNEAHSPIPWRSTNSITSDPCNW